MIRRVNLVRRAWLALLWPGILVMVGLLWAHEGHHYTGKGVILPGDIAPLSKEARLALGVQTADAVPRTLERTVPAHAVVLLQPRAHAYATSLLPGRVETVLISPGQQVRRGELLAHIRSLELEKLELDVLTARYELQLAGQELDRVEQLLRQGLKTQQDHLAARSRQQERANNLVVAELKLQALGLDPGSRSPSTAGLLPLLAPIGGKVDQMEMGVGTAVDPQQHLAHIVEPDQIRVRADVPEAYVAHVRVGQRVRFRLPNATAERGHQATILPGTVVARDGRVNQRTLTEHVWIRLDATDLTLPPGMAGQVEIIVEERANVLAVPANALIRDGMETYVFVQLSPGEYKRVMITTGLVTPDYVEVTGGLRPYAPVIVQGGRQIASRFITETLRPSAEARRNTGLATQPVGRQGIAPTLDLDVVLELLPDQRALITVPLTGKVTELLVTEPGAVAAGAPLARIASLEFQNLQLELIQAELAARLHENMLESYARAEAEQKGLISRQLLQEAENGLQIAQARGASLRRRLATVGLATAEIDAIVQKKEVLQTFVLRATRAGDLIPSAAVLGDTVKEGTPLFEIQNRGQLFVRARAFEEDLSRLREGQAARLRLASVPGKVIATRLSRLDSLPEPGGRTRAVWAVADNPDGSLREGMLGRLTVEVAPPAEVLAVPVSALLREGTQWNVFVHDRPTDTFQLRRVAVGRKDDRSSEILSGVAEGEIVAVAAVTDLRRAHGRIK